MRNFCVFQERRWVYIVRLKNPLHMCTWRHVKGLYCKLEQSQSPATVEGTNESQRVLGVEYYTAMKRNGWQLHRTPERILGISVAGKKELQKNTDKSFPIT